MNRKQFIILLVLVAVVGGAGLIIHQRASQSWQSTDTTIGQKVLPGLAVNDIAQITIQAGTNKLNLAKVDSRWCVGERGNYPADFSQISSLLLKFADLKVVQTEDVEPSQLDLFKLLPPGTGTNTGTQIEFTDAGGKSLGSVLLGKSHMSQSGANSQFGGESWPDGRYVMAGGGVKTVALVSDPLDSVQATPTQWLDKDFFSITKPRSITVQFPVATNSWKLTRESETSDWQLADAKAGEKLDTTKISDVTDLFASPTFSDVMVGDTKLAVSGLTNVTTLTVTTFDGFTYTAKIGQEKNDDYPLTLAVTADLPTKRTAGKDEKPADKAKLDEAFQTQEKTLADKLASEKQLEKWIYLLPSYTVQPVLKSRDQLLVTPVEPAKATVAPAIK